MNLYSNKQKWKIVLLIFTLVLVSAFLFISNSIVQKVSQRERERAKQWGGAIQKKLELVQLTNQTFTQLRDRELEKMELLVKAQKEVLKPGPTDNFSDYTFPMSIINENNDIPVILLENDQYLSQFRNIDLDTNYYKERFPSLSKKERNQLLDDSIIALSKVWKEKNPSFTIEVFKGFSLTYIYNDSKKITKLENDRDSLITAFNQDLIDNEGLVPVLLVDADTDSIIGSNLPKIDLKSKNITKTKAKLSAQNQPILIEINNQVKTLLYYDSSPELKQLQYYPYIQFFIIGLFVLIAYLIFSTFRKAEQNQVWAGMAKETAHQLGTPLSSLMAWVTLLENEPIDPMFAIEMQKDVDRLEKVTDRFSKIGSGAKLSDTNLSETVENVLEYLKPRISTKVIFEKNIQPNVETKHNGPLIEWVVENICKNGVDAMNGVGEMSVRLVTVPEWAHIDITDSGKGISNKLQKTIFQPGFSTKQRGWGLGLSLVKRIVTEYHSGKVFVLNSEINKGTTFRISIPL